MEAAAEAERGASPVPDFDGPFLGCARDSLYANHPERVFAYICVQHQALHEAAPALIYGLDVAERKVKEFWASYGYPDTALDVEFCDVLRSNSEVNRAFGLAAEAAANIAAFMRTPNSPPVRDSVTVPAGVYADELAHWAVAFFPEEPDPDDPDDKGINEFSGRKRGSFSKDYSASKKANAWLDWAARWFTGYSLQDAFDGCRQIINAIEPPAGYSISFAEKGRVQFGKPLSGEPEPEPDEFGFGANANANEDAEEGGFQCDFDDGASFF